MKKITVSILSVLMMLSMVFSSSVFAAEKEVSAWDAFLGLFGAQTSDVSDVGVEYRGHVENKGDFPLDGTWIQGPDQLGTVGEGLRLEAFWIKLAEDAPAGLHIKYQVHVQNKGWMGFVNDGAMAGTEGEGLRIEAIQISLVDDEGNIADGYSVEYRGHVQNIGDTEWYADGDQLGTTGSGLRLEALEIKIVQTKADMTAYNAAVAAAAALTETDYTAESWAALQTALAVVVTEDNTQAEVDAATAAINDAIAGLVKVTTIDLTATGLKQLTVTFNNPVADTATATFAVIKGTSTNISVSSINWNTEKTVAELTLASKLTDGTYTVNVSNVVEEVLTDSVTTEAETVGSIEIASDVAVYNSAKTDFTVGYKVYNQYGDDITTSIAAGNFTPNATNGAAGVVLTPATGVATIEDGTLTVGDTTTLTIVHNTTGEVASKKLTCSDPAGVSEIAFGDLYNEDGLTLSEDNTDELFYIAVNAKDQYGSSLNAAALNAAGAVSKATSDATILQALNFVDLDTNDDGTDETYLQLDAANMTEGTAKLTVISLFNGAKATTTQVVAAAKKVDTISLSQPDLAVVKETVKIPFEAVDNFGGDVTSLALLSQVNFGFSYTDLAGSATASFKKNASTGAIELVLDLTSVTDGDNDGGKIVVTATTPTGEVTVLTVTVEEEAIPVAVTGIQNIVLNPTVDNTISVEWKNLTFADQFDRAMDYSDVPGAYGVDVVVDNTAIATVAPAEMTSVTPTVLTGEAKGTTDITFTLNDGVNPVADSDYTTQVRVAATSEFTSYEASTVATLYDDHGATTNAYERDLEVYGVLSNGTKVVLPSANYTVRITGQTAVTAVAGTNVWTLGVDKDETITYPTTEATEATAQAIVTINASGQELAQTITISKVAPKVATLVFDTTEVVSGGYDLTDHNYLNAATILGFLDAAESTDTYGEAISAFAAATGASFANDQVVDEPTFVTITNVTDVSATKTLTITGNGTNAAAVTNIETGDSFTVTIGFNGGATISFNVSANIADEVAPTIAYTSSSGDTNLVATLSEALYIDGVAIGDETIAVSNFTLSDDTKTITTATYDSTAKTITFVLPAAIVDNATITAKTTLTDATGNSIASTIIGYLDAVTDNKWEAIAD